jgi:hypothetical protein
VFASSLLINLVYGTVLPTLRWYPETGCCFLRRQCTAEKSWVRIFKGQYYGKLLFLSGAGEGEGRCCFTQLQYIQHRLSGCSSSSYPASWCCACCFYYYFYYYCTVCTYNIKTRIEWSIKSQIEKCDAVLVVGSSLEVFSAFRFVDRASKQGASIGILNWGETRAERVELCNTPKSRSW